jgi:HAD superfamily hydrolase (TIGR01509 family)
MIKLIIFDLDGVLVEAKQIHFETLNQALSEVSNEYVISETEHHSIYDGLKTNQKLEMLSKKKGLPVSEYDKVWRKKQELTIQAITKLQRDERLIDLMKTLRTKGFQLACCSNSIRRSVLVMLSKIGLIEYMDLILSNEDVKNSKPHPEIYWKAMSSIGVLPDETLIIEDSPVGLQAAERSHAEVLRVSNTLDLTIDKVENKLKENKNMKKPKWSDKKLNVLIPMAGAGSRFEKAGYTFPKPLIDVKGEPMIKVVSDNLNIEANFIYVVQKSHREKYNLDTLLNLISPNCKIVEVDGLTEGAACTTLLAKELINNNQPLLMANSDQFIEWDSNEFLYKMNETNADGGIVTFRSTHPKWSFAKINELGFVTEVAEKNPISDIATVGVYYWKRGSDYVKYAEQMIENNKRVNNEFYVCPIFNEAIQGGSKIRIYEIEKMWGLGTPEDLEVFLKQ